ncbi:MAG: flagellar export protein FliJ [Spirochaetales bacterium]|nr:flagellar export protein FliJ [Spirochaetales bacterium]
MKRFQFRLEKLLDLRKFREREWELKLAEITGQCLLIKKKIAELKQEIYRCMLERKQTEKSVNMDDLHLNELYVQRLEQNIDALSEELERKEEERKKIHAEYMEAAKKRKVLDKLKEKRSEEYYHIHKLEEFKKLDEINNSALIRSKITN